MKALVCEALAPDFSRVSLRDVATPSPGAGQVRVKVEAASLNFPDLLMLKGEYQFKPGTSGHIVLSNDADGHVVADAVSFVPVADATP